jgi:DNA-binding NarL/FixJ family response regulator
MLNNRTESIIRVVIIDDHPGVRTSIRSILENTPDIRVVSEADSGIEALRLVELHQPDVLLLDMEMPKMNGVEVARRLQNTKTNTSILALSAYDDRQFILGMLSAGAAGYLLKEEAREILVDAVRGVAQGMKGWLSSRLAKQLKIWPTNPTPNALESLERELLRLMCKRQNDQEIMTTLNLNEAKLNDIVQGLIGKLKVTSRDEVIDWANRHNLCKD